ncbi:hypothetical protein AOH412_07810 [Helicobacter pylori]|nr:hypothetical protein JP0088_04640 [Helicobacter pylori]GHR44873.1 hypothetical protein JP0098_05510 [Helicobacter pylori]
MANKSIEGGSYQLKDILATELSAYYQIPTYQRPYQWTKKLRKAFRRFAF